MHSHNLRSIGVLGAGKVGVGIARQALKAGYDVSIATAKPPEDIRLIVEFTAPGATVVTADALMRDSDLIVLALPLGKYRTLDREGLAGKIAIDVMNYWEPTDGTIEEFCGPRASSEVVQVYLDRTKIVRSLNHLGYHELVENALPSGHPHRQALAIAGDAPDARRLVSEFVDRIGFDPVDAGPLKAARAFDVATPIFGARLTRTEMLGLLGETTEELAA